MPTDLAAAGEGGLVAWVRQRLEAILERAWQTGEPEYEPVWRLRGYALDEIETWNEVVLVEDLAHATLVAMPPEPGPLPEWPWTR